VINVLRVFSKFSLTSTKSYLTHMQQTSIMLLYYISALNGNQGSSVDKVAGWGLDKWSSAHYRWQRFCPSASCPNQCGTDRAS
jgi:hypothetical protein